MLYPCQARKKWEKSGKKGKKPRIQDTGARIKEKNKEKSPFTP